MGFQSWTLNMMNEISFQRQPVEMPVWRVPLSTSVLPVMKFKISLHLQSTCLSIAFNLVIATCMIVNAFFEIPLLEQISSYQQATSPLINDPSVRSVNMQRQGGNGCGESLLWWTRVQNDLSRILTFVQEQLSWSIISNPGSKVERTAHLEEVISSNTSVDASSLIT